MSVIGMPVAPIAVVAHDDVGALFIKDLRDGSSHRKDAGVDERVVTITREARVCKAKIDHSVNAENLCRFGELIGAPLGEVGGQCGVAQSGSTIGGHDQNNSVAKRRGFSHRARG